MRDLLGRRAAIVTIAGPADPGLLAGAPPERVARGQSRTLPGRLPYLRAVSAGTARFCVVSWPNEAWAAGVYPELEPEAALAALERDVASFARIAPGDPDGAWGAHVAALADRAQGLTGRSLRELRLRGPGTDLRLGLPEGALWQGGTLEGPTGRFSPNVPTEEVLHEPVARPRGRDLRLHPAPQAGGRTIEGLGRTVLPRSPRAAGRGPATTTATTWPPTSREQSRTATAWARSRSSTAARVARAGRTYGTTLLDESAASHIALGSGFAFARAPGRRSGPTARPSTWTS